MDQMKSHLKKLLDNLDCIAERAEEVCDTDVRERMSEAVQNMFIVPRDGYFLPKEFGMFEPENDQKVRSALKTFFDGVTPLIGELGFKTPQERLDAFQNENLESEEGSFYDDYFGYAG